jgi:Zn-dependent protease with chaperone function
MSARFLDGHSARAHPAEVEIVDGGLIIRADGVEHLWPLHGVSVVQHAGEARVSHKISRDARLVMPLAEWKALSGLHGKAIARRGGRRETTLVLSLAAVGLGVTAFVFWGVPALSGPLARATPVAFEQRMGANFDNQMGLLFHRCEGAEGQYLLADLGRRIAAEADTPFDVRVRAVHAPMINAFALPGGPVLVTDDLIREAGSPDELSAVIAHEVSHIEKRHVMQAVWRSLGLGLLLDAVVGGGSGAGQQAVLLAGQATDLRYGRGAESEADGRGQQLLHGLGLSSKGMAPFFARLDRREAGDATEFMSTHPDSRRRSDAARSRERAGAPAFSETEWAAVKAACGSAPDGPIDRLERRFRVGRDPSMPDQGDQVRQH